MERSATNYRNSMKGRLAPLMNKQINSITEEDVLGWFKRNVVETRGQTQQDFRHLRAVLTYQVELNNLESNPTQIIKTLKLNKKLPRKETYLSPEQLGSLIQILPKFRLKDAHTRKQTNLWLFILLTGLRQQNVYNLKWSQVALEDSIWIETTKNGDSYHLPLTTLLDDLLKQQRQIVDNSINPKCEYVFPNIRFDGPANDPKKVLSRLYREADITERDKKTGEFKPMPFRDHDLRRTFATLAGLSKVSEAEIKHLMIHRGKNITQEYMHSQEIRAMENYEKIIELIASSVPITSYTDDYGDNVIQQATPEILRYMLYKTGDLADALAKDPTLDANDLIVEASKIFYNTEKRKNWS